MSGHEYLYEEKDPMHEYCSHPSHTSDDQEQQARDEAYQEGRTDERRLIVEWLYDSAEWTQEAAEEYWRELGMNSISLAKCIINRTYDAITRQIENGEHLKGDK